jgi:FdrA protein
VGGRDLSDAVGGISTLMAIDLLEQDAATEHLVLISKPPGAATARHVLQRLQTCRKPVTVCFIGYDKAAERPPGIHFAATLRQAAEQATGGQVAADIAAEVMALAPTRRYLKGLYSGGTLCAEAQVILQQAGLSFTSNVPIPGVTRLHEGRAGHYLIDLGADEYTVGRPHPMIEPAVRNEILAKTLAQTDTAVILLDVVLGYGSHSDPAGAVADTILSGSGEKPAIVASVCGVDGDPQDYRAQVKKLTAAGVMVVPSNAHAAELAGRIIEAHS